jgi:hypothetical protein
MKTPHKHLLGMLSAGVILLIFLCYRWLQHPAPGQDAPSPNKDVAQGRQDIHTPAPMPGGTASSPRNQHPPTNTHDFVELTPVRLDGPPSTVGDLLDKGFPVMSNARKACYGQTVAQTTAEVVDDLGNVMIMMYCSLGRGGGSMAMPSEILHYHTRIMPNMKVIRLIEEGRKDPVTVSGLLSSAVKKCLTEYDKDHQAWDDSRARGENASGTGDNDAYYNKYRKYECPQMEFRRIHDVAYMSLYILADIGGLDADLLAEWIRKEKPELYDCTDMDLWLVDAYFNQGSVPSDAAQKHAALRNALNIAGKKTVQSKWNAIWDIHDQLFKAANIHPDDIETIETLVIPPELPPALDQNAKSQIFENFFEYAKEEPLR